MRTPAVSESRAEAHVLRAGVYLVYRETGQRTGKDDVDNRLNTKRKTGRFRPLTHAWILAGTTGQ